MEMNIHLDSDIFDIVKNKSKDVEIRLNDLKRRKLNVGDTLIFLKRQFTSSMNCSFVIFSFNNCSFNNVFIPL